MRETGYSIQNYKKYTTCIDGIDTKYYNLVAGIKSVINISIKSVCLNYPDGLVRVCCTFKAIEKSNAVSFSFLKETRTKASKCYRFYNSCIGTYNKDNVFTL